MLEQAERHDSIGSLLRQPRFHDQDGNEVLFDELLGRDFAIVGRTRQDIRLSDASAALFEKLGGRLVVLDEVDLFKDEVDRIFESSPAAVLRPDRIVFGVVDDTTSLDDLMVTLGSRLRLL